MKDFPEQKPEIYSWNEWAIYIVSAIKSNSEDTDSLEKRVEELEKEIDHLKRLKVKDVFDDYNIFKTQVKTRTALIAFAISFGLGLATLLIAILKLHI